MSRVQTGATPNPRQYEDRFLTSVDSSFCRELPDKVCSASSLPLTEWLKNLFVNVHFMLSFPK